jgi:hypothetical protein
LSQIRKSCAEAFYILIPLEKASFVAAKLLPAQIKNALYGFVWSIQGKMKAGVKIKIRMSGGSLAVYDATLNS